MELLDRLSVEDLKLNTEEYDYWMRKRRPDGWLIGQKRENYKNLLRIVELSGVAVDEASCLDVGCGSGDLSPFLRDRGISRYLGVDVYEPAVVRARKRYPHEEFLLGDFLALDLQEKFDYAFLSGAISVNLDSDNHAFVRSMAAKMWQLTRVGFALNFLTDDDPEIDSNQDKKFYSIPEVEKLCRQAAPEAAIEHFRHPYGWQASVYAYRFLGS